MREGSALGGEDLERAVRAAEAALTLDAPEAGALVRRLAAPPPDRVWGALVTDGGVVLASLSSREPTVGHLDLLAVHPERQGRGLGRELVRAAEEWLRGRGATQVRLAGNPPCYAWPGVDVRYTAAACLAESLGYERYHVAWNMTAPLGPGADLSTEADEALLAGQGVAVRRAGDDRDRVAAFVAEHWNERWAWEAANAAGLHYAERDGRVLAFAAWGARPAWFGPMGTAPEARGLGVGRVLLRRCLAEQRAAGQDTAEIGWVGPLRFYARAVGARAERVFWLYRRDLA
ncbi:GNAT family N-acetyltransferase [Nonomuraea roseoviolacea]|uniref:GNAT superfamily N-acetyltransferase n=1 Tax=Nonomuraea roseoviolacea subsp. carminata TaxID=160689 RepID=A0ABT1KFJ0_9ACTN|nr:GNAT family N-acetyltransferase [Nonomuraea roseoviolacea]MCP2352786.1 GNAT superfamily N-acetyltransferase [Nonomuraea roseoviolacea subsp. carminata]